MQKFKLQILKLVLVSDILYFCDACLLNYIKIDDQIKDGDRLALPIKDLGSCEVYPQTLKHSPNGRFVSVCGDGEYIIYTALAWRNKSFGNGLECVWATDSNIYAARESTSRVKVFKNFKERNGLLPAKLSYPSEGIFGGGLLGVRSSNFLIFYDWETGVLVRRIDVECKDVSCIKCDIEKYHINVYI